MILAAHHGVVTSETLDGLDLVVAKILAAVVDHHDGTSGRVMVVHQSRQMLSALSTCHQSQ